MNMSNAIEDYQQLSGITARMRAAAAEGDWDELIALEKECARRMAQIRLRDSQPADEAGRRQKAALIRKMLADDKAIREQTEPWMRQLEKIMQSARHEQRLQQAYLAQG